MTQAASDSLSDDGKFTRVPYHDPSALHPVRLVAKPLVLAHLGNRDLTGSSPRQPIQRVNRGTPDYAVVRKTDILLELLNRPLSSRPKNAVDPVWVETKLAEPPLELRHIIATHHRRAVIEEPITETVVGLNEGVP